MASDVLYSWSRRISRPAAAAVFRAALVVIVVAALVAVDVVRKTDDAREPSRFAGGALRRGWTSAKVWWNRDVVLGEKKYPTLTEDEVARLWGPARLEEHEDKFKFDFEDSYPSEPYYAYVWYAMGPVEICCALTALSNMIKLNLTAGRSKRIDFLLYYTHSRNVEDAANEESEDFIISEDLVSQWLTLGGQSEAVEVQSRPLQRYELLRRLKLKFQCLTLKGYREFVILDPMGIPLKSLDHIFLEKENRSIYRVSAPVADVAEAAAAETGIGRPTCFGDVKPPVSTHLMSILPGERTTSERLVQHFGGRHDGVIWNDAMAVNHEFACNDELEVLPRSYSVADYEFLKDSSPHPRAVKDAHYVHFSMDTKPWDINYDFEVLPQLTGEASALLSAWKNMASDICDFRPENGGWPIEN